MMGYFIMALLEIYCLVCW